MNNQCQECGGTCEAEEVVCFGCAFEDSQIEASVNEFREM